MSGNDGLRHAMARRDAATVLRDLADQAENALLALERGLMAVPAGGGAGDMDRADRGDAQDDVNGALSRVRCAGRVARMWQRDTQDLLSEATEARGGAGPRGASYSNGPAGPKWEAGVPKPVTHWDFTEGRQYE